MPVQGRTAATNLRHEAKRASSWKTLVCVSRLRFSARFWRSPPPLHAAPAKLGITAPEQALGWIKGYRERPAPKAVPGLVRELASVGAFQEPEGAGVYVGFMAGVIAANPKTADALIAEMAKVPPRDQWAVIKAIAYSRADNWRGLLARASKSMPTAGGDDRRLPHRQDARL